MAQSATPEISITFLGGASSIGASCALLEAGAARIIIDCGVRLNGPNPLPDLSLLGEKSIDAIIVTHAHFDHTGALPLITDAFEGTPVIASAPTADLAAILLRDAVKLMESPDRESDIPLYSEAQVQRCIDRFTPLAHRQSRAVGDVTVTMLPASHILGASMVHCATPAGNVLFTGDYSVQAQRTVPALTRPTVHADMVVSESTYGQRLHEDRTSAENRLVAQVNAVLLRGGSVLIPAFAIGRAQEVILILKKALRSHTLPEVPVFVDGMVRQACNVYGSYPGYVTRALAHESVKNGHPFYTNGIIPVGSAAARHEILRRGPCVIVASSGMLSGGASAFYAAALAQDERNAILITGYQDEESPGRALLNLTDASEAREVRIGGQNVTVRCQVEKYGLSAHADRMQMTGLVESFRPRTVVLVHGDTEARQSLAKALSCQDVVLGAEGSAITRSYPLRRTAMQSVSWESTLVDIDRDRARGILGPAGEAPQPAGKIAAAWFGTKVPAAAAEALVDALERLRLVRRDDRRRSMLWVLSPAESGAFPSELALEEELKKANPKGRLLELCTHKNSPMPQTAFSTQGQWHVAEIAVTVDGRTIQSNPCKAASRKTAEQLAALAILRQLGASDESGDFIEVAEQSAERLRQDNAKGKLLELCTKYKIEEPGFTRQPTINGFAVSACVTINNEYHASRRFRASTLKTAQQAAAADLLSTLQKLHPGQSKKHPCPAKQTSDHRSDLNSLRQQGVLSDFGYEVTAKQGPDHKPSFIMTGWVKTKEDKILKTGQIVAEVKKDGALKCANELWEMLKKREII